MTKLILIFLAIISIPASHAQSKPVGVFVGVEEMESLDPANPNHKWYHLGELTFTKDSVFLEQSPITIYKKDTMFSASDGGFYSYTGIIGYRRGKKYVDLKLKNCDYCPQQMVSFTPPRIIKDEDVGTDTTTRQDEKTKKDEEAAWKSQSKVKLFELKIIDANTIMLDKNIYRRKK